MVHKTLDGSIIRTVAELGRYISLVHWISFFMHYLFIKVSLSSAFHGFLLVTCSIWWMSRASQVPPCE